MMVQSPSPVSPGSAAGTAPVSSRAWLMLVLATVGFAVNFWAWALLSPLGPRFHDDLDLTSFEQSLLVAVPVVVGSLGRIPVGALVTCVATVDYVGNSSMDISVDVYAERISTGERRHTNTAHVVFVAIDADGKPRKVPRLVPETDEERGRYARAEAHRHRQRQHAAK